MGALVEAVAAASREGIAELAETIFGEMTAIVSKHTHSGGALGAIRKEVGDTHAFVGGTHMHLYFLDQGNGTGGIPKRGLPKAPMPLTYGTGVAHGYAMHVRNYKGIYFCREIANRHR